MVIITDAFLAAYAEEKLEGGLYTEGDRLDRLQIDPTDGIAKAALIVHYHRPSDDPDLSAINIELIYPWGGRRPIPGLDIQPQQHGPEDGAVFFDVGIDSGVEGRHEYVVTDLADGSVTVPVELFQ
jgi:hypothetical protein